MEATDGWKILTVSVIIFLFAIATAGAQTPEDFFDRAESSYWSEKYDTAVEFYQTVVDSTDSPALVNDARFGLARALTETGELERAAQLYERVTDQHPDRSVRGDALFSRIEIALLRDERKKARRLLSDFRENYSDHVLYPVARDEFGELFEQKSETAGDESARPDTAPEEAPEQPEDREVQQPEPGRDTDPSVPASLGDTVVELPEREKEAGETGPPDTAPGSTRRPGGAEPPVRQELSGTDATRLPETRQQPSREPDPRPGTSAREGAYDDTSPEKRLESQPLDPVEALAHDSALRRQLIAELERLKQRNTELQRRLKRARTRKDELRQRLDRRPPPEQISERLRKRYREQLEEFRQDYQNLRKRLMESRDENDELNSRIRDLQQEIAELEQSNELLQNRNERLQDRLSGEVINALREGRLHDLPADVQLSDTAVQSLENRSSELLKQARKALENESYDAAINNLQPLLEASPDSAVLFLAARAYWRLSGEAEPAVDYLRQGFSKTERPPVEEMLLMVQVLLETERSSELENFLEANRDYIRSRVEGELKARWHYLLGRRLAAAGESDRAFFELMNAVDSAPDSQWARRARRFIDNEL